MYAGDTSYDIFESMQVAGVLPATNSFIFKTLLKGTKLIAAMYGLREKMTPQARIGPSSLRAKAIVCG